MKKVWIQASPGVVFPREDRPRERISDQEPTCVVDSPYYRRGVQDGDLVAANKAKKEAP